MLIRFGGIDPARFRDFLAAGKEYSRGDAACLYKKEWHTTAWLALQFPCVVTRRAAHLQA